MASCLQAASMNSLILRSSYSFSSLSLNSPDRKNLKSFCYTFRAKAAAKIPMPPINPNDHFLSTLASVAAQSPEKLFNRPVNSDTLPYLDIWTQSCPMMQVITNRDIFVELLSKHTGNSVETVANVMRRPYYMDAPKAKEFGVIDKILWRGQEKIIADIVPSEDFDKNTVIRSAERV
ncbi:unnamed protein product [Eruca vesicaria subsp. sativa]|uniref:ATP-dependent Clp protease proteolytic subunit n=1 Tax=Eruca vesicaria subsp. sativa TaxID=29727 RepID=A0ABC8KKC9_ERUVS|nr:unnamed protein product [Eruca vesicaria subsp. sativa]